MTCEVDDDFTGIDGSPPNSTLWTYAETPGNPSSPLADIRSNELRFNEPGSGGTWYAHVKSKWYFGSGADLDVQVDFSSLSWDGYPNDWFYLPSLQILDDSDPVNWARVVRGSNASVGDGYFAQGTGGPWHFFQKGDTYGKLRITRSGTTIKAYMWNNSLSRWEWNGSTAGYTLNENFTGNTWVRIQWRSPAETYQADVDNFLVNAGCDDIIAGWTGKICGATNPSKVCGVPTSYIGGV